ncbi:MAG: hypothetical protein BMS9Abin36_1721 [Gammaproteobacteria bacterium]|nr:MAG: hypothetical protein BMS9Abin36_1721 [Gammaproteobacteria bacterium]
MYTRCPQCKTTFAITQDQLGTREGLVRCGHCTAIFKADKYIIKQSGKTSADEVARIEHATSAPQHRRLPTVAELLASGRRRTRNVHTGFWASAIVVLSLVWAGQYAWFHRYALLRDTQVRSYVAKVCGKLGCGIPVLQDVGLVELLDTRVTPHRGYENALRIKATLVNRARFAQPYPRLEVTLTDREGKMISRRVFDASQYLKKKSENALKLLPNIAAGVLLEISYPSDKAQGYEVRLLPA